MYRLMRVVFALSFALGTLLGGVRCSASPIVSGSVSFDSITHLYTYSYVLDYSGPERITEWGVLINSFDWIPSLVPSAFTSPAGWNFVANAVGYVPPPADFGGTFWDWVPLEKASSSGDFSFTTSQAPTPFIANNNYFVFSGQTLTEYGHVVAPDFLISVPPVVTPEPPSIMLLASGLLTGVGIFRRKCCNR